MLKITLILFDMWHIQIKIGWCSEFFLADFDQQLKCVRYFYFFFSQSPCVIAPLIVPCVKCHPTSSYIRPIKKMEL